MSDYNPVLHAPEGANKKPKRVGRGSSSGLGTTAGKGNKGQQSRSGGGNPYVGFEGGQMPIYRRLPKRGFNNVFRKIYAEVNIETLNRFEDGAVVDHAILAQGATIAAGAKVEGEEGAIAVIPENEVITAESGSKQAG